MSDKITSNNPVSTRKKVDADPDSFESLMETWNSLFERSVTNDDRTFADVEKVAFNLSQDASVPVVNTAVGRQVGQLLEQFDSPVFLVRENGQVITQNTVALRTFGMGPGDSLDDLPFNLDQDQPIADVVRGTLQPSRNMHDAVLKRAYSAMDDASVTLSIAPSKPLVAGQGEALVFVVDARWKTDSAGLIKREFDLTEAENELLEAFLDGQSTQDMAASRNRSHATVRTQFHSLMTKMGARSQVELFRNALSISQFVDKVDNIAEVLRHPYRKRVDVVRPGGRSVEVTMAGDFKGKPLVFLQGCYAYTFQALIEKAFFDAGFCVLSICRPGTGDTDPALEGEGYFETFSGDLAALLNQLGHDTCMMMTSNTSTGFMFHAATHLKGRISGLILVAANAPMPYFQEADIVAPWVLGMYRAAKNRPTMFQVFNRMGARAYRAMGQARFITLQFFNDPKELEIVKNPTALKESEHALETYMRQGIASFVKDITISFSDFTPEVRQTDVPILILHGTGDQVFGIGAMRRFAQDFAERTTFVEVEGATFSAVETHTTEIIHHLRAFHDKFAAG